MTYARTPRVDDSMTRRSANPTYAAGIIERHDHHFLIALSEGATQDERLWHFPRGLVEAAESPEAAMRRIAQTNLSIAIDIMIGQPPIVAVVDGESLELRYFFCGVIEGEASAGPYAEIRWVSKAHLREYDFDDVSSPVVDWILDS